MLKIEKIYYSDSGKRINYDYNYDKNIAKYFNARDPYFAEYDVYISDIPESIAIIPFLANVAPIAWFAGFSIEVNEIDNEFADSLEAIKKEFIKNHPNIDARNSKLIVNKFVKNNYSASKSAMLFSGGADAYATYFRHNEENLDLLTIHGADIEISDIKQWDRVVSLNKEESIIKDNLNLYIKSNLRTFYTHNVELLLPNLGWWGKVQHGLALNSLIAPLSIIRGYKISYIASSYTDNIDIVWGSTPDIDNKIKWGDTKISHDGYDLKRQEKIDLIVKSVKQINSDINLRVCYSELNKGINCSKCEKCYRTMMGIILNGENPEKYGFKIEDNIYSEIENMLRSGFSSEGNKYFWWEISEKMKETNDIYVHKDKHEEKDKINELEKLIKVNLTNEIKDRSNFSKIKFYLQNSFPKLFKIYLKYRQRNL